MRKFLILAAACLAFTTVSAQEGVDVVSDDAIVSTEVVTDEGVN